MAVNLLIVADGNYIKQPAGGGFSFLGDAATGTYVQDTTDDTFTLSEFIYLIKSSFAVTVTIAHRDNDPGADIPNFTFTADISQYDVICMFGYEGWNAQYWGTPIAPSELQAITNFMNAGGGIFATGDHNGMGSYMCGLIPRVRSMRMWFGQESDLPTDYPGTSVDSTGATIPSVNWPGVSVKAVGSAPARGRADTLQENPTDTPTEFHFDDQSDNIPQALDFPGGVVHPILQGRAGTISHFPDHMHEGEVVTPSDLTQVLTINGQQYTEYPSVNDVQPAPSIIATGTVVGDHTTLVEGVQGGCEQKNFTTDTSNSVARPLGILCAYDGWDVGVGRVVTDSSFHHYLDLNLIGDPCGFTPDRRQGFTADGTDPYTPPAAGTMLGDLQDFYLNTILWLSPTGAPAPPIISSISPPTGSTLGGTEVYIQGSGFDSSTEIYFGNTPAASARPVDDGLAGFVAYSPPANAGPVDITARAGISTSVTSPADVFTYVYLPGAGSIDVSSNVLWAGETITGTVTLDEPADSEGVTVTMDIPDPTGVTVPASVVINPGETSATFPITASATVSGGAGVEGPGVAGAAIVYASGPDGTEIESPLIEVYAGQIVVILPSALLIGPGLVSGDTATGTIVVRTPAPASSGLITLSASHADAVSIPASLPLPGGGTSATFTLTALQVSGTFGVTISASYEGNSSTSPLFKVIAHEPPPRPPVPPPPPPRGPGKPF